jgi:hypothetical protein
MSPKAHARCARAAASPLRLRTHVAEAAVPDALEHGVWLPVPVVTEELDVLAEVGVRGEELLVAVVVEIIGARPPPAHQDGGEAEAGPIGGGGEEALGCVEVERKGIPAQSCHEDVRAAILVEVAEIDAHAGDGYSVLRVGDGCLHRVLDEREPPAFRKKKCLIWSFGHEDVGESVRIRIRHRDAHAFPMCAPIPVGPDTSVNRPPPSLR